MIFELFAIEIAVLAACQFTYWRPDFQTPTALKFKCA
jgi:hypothetical protein